MEASAPGLGGPRMRANDEEFYAPHRHRFVGINFRRAVVFRDGGKPAETPSAVG